MFTMSCAASALLLLGTAAPADDAEHMAVPAEIQEHTPQAEMEVSDFTFAGGSIVDYSEAIRQTFPDANIVIDPRVAGFQMPSMKLHDVNIEGLVWLTQGIQGVWSNAEYTCDMSRFGYNDAQRIYRLTAVRQTAARGRVMAHPPGSTYTVIRSIAGILDEGQLTPDEVMSAIGSAMKMDGDDGVKTEVSYHEKTKLIMLHGTNANMDTFEEVLEQLSDTSSVLSTAAHRRQPGHDDGPVEEG